MSVTTETSWKGGIKLVVAFSHTRPPSPAFMDTLKNSDTPDGEWLAAIIEELGPGHWQWEQEFDMWFWIQEEAQDGIQ